MKNILFVSGVGRSGTSALVNVLNAHPGLLIGQERFFRFFRKELIAPEHFEKERFLDIREEDTHNMTGLRGAPADLAERYDNAVYIGDKFPSLFRHFDRVFDLFPDARHLYIVRNPLSVLESYDVRHKNPEDHWKLTYQDGMDAWNESVGKASRLPPEQLAKFTIVQYEELYASTAAINGMFGKLGLPPAAEQKLQPFVDKFASLNDKEVARRDDLRLYVARNADWDSYRRLCQLMEQ